MPRTPEQFEEIREKTRNKILESSLSLFANNGYHGTSMRDIAKEAGISKGLAYNYFASKKDIMLAVLKKLDDLGTAAASAIDWDGDPYVVLKSIITETFNLIEGDEDFWRMYFSFSLQPEVLAEAKEISGEFARFFFRKMEDAFKRIGLPNPRAEAKILGAIIDGASFHYFYLKDYSLKDTKKYLLKKYSREELEKIKK